MIGLDRKSNWKLEQTESARGLNAVSDGSFERIFLENGYWEYFSRAWELSF